MVIPDGQGSAPAPAVPPIIPPAPLTALSRPADRLAAVIIDVFVVLMPAYLLLSAPFKLELTTNFLLGSETGIFIYVIAQILLSIGLIIFYQAYMHSRWGATVGKMIFHLRVRTIWGHGPPTFAAGVKRAVVWCLEVIGVGIPWLGIFTDNQRRILHDRICDTEVISLKDHGVRPPKGMERGLVQGVLGFFMLLFMASLIGSLVQGMKHVNQERGLASLLSQDDKTCSEVSAALDTLDKDQEPPTRLQMAMSLYAAGNVDKDCLAYEVEQDLDVKLNSSPLGYLAKAFVHSEEADVSDAYLEQVCQDGPGSPECSMSQLVSSWSDENWQEVDEVISNAKPGSVYLEIWAVRHYLKQGQYEKALGFIGKISPNRAVASFLQTQRVKALWNLHRELESETAAAQALDSMTPAERQELSSWVCLEQLSRDCSGAERPSCAWVQKHLTKNNLDMSDATIGLAQLRVQECEKDPSIDYISLADSSEDDAWKVFLRASSKTEKHDQDSAAALFSQVIKQSEAADELRLEALRRFLMLAKSTDILDMVGSWREMKSGELWRKAGNLLLASLIRREEKTVALKVARSLMSQKALNRDGVQSLASLVQSPEGGEHERSPASTDLQDKVRELLEATPEEAQ